MTNTPLPSLIDKSEEDLYEIAYSEVNADTRRQGLWAKALSESMGDEQKAQALYIRLRTEQLTNSRRQQLLDNVFPFECPGCGKPRAVRGSQIANCYVDDWDDFECPHCKHLDDIRDILPFSTIEIFAPCDGEHTRPFTPAIPASYADDKWSSGAMVGLIIATIFIPIIGLILGLINSQASPDKKQQAKTLLIIACIVMAIGFVLMVASRVILYSAF